MTANSEERITRIHELDKKHQSNVHEIDLVNRDEEARRLKLRALALRDENATLKDKLSKREARLKHMSKQSDEVHIELAEAKELAQSRLAELKRLEGQLKSFQAEQDAWNDSLKSSDEVLREKLRLDTELKRMKPEYEQLKLQLKTYDKVVAEKQELQRQLNSAEADLENERRSKQRNKLQEDDSALEDLRSELEAAKKELATEKKEREKVKKEHEREMQEIIGKNERLEERLATMKSNLKSAKTELKDVRAELEESRLELEASRKASRNSEERQSKTATTKALPARKRRMHDLSIDDMTIGTPGPSEATFLKRPVKKRGIEHLLKEKSTFSVTPYLTKTMDVADESVVIPSPTAQTSTAPGPNNKEKSDESESVQVEAEKQPEDPSEDPPVEAASEHSQGSPSESEKPPARKVRGRPKGKALADAPISRKNMPASSKDESAAKVRRRSKLNQVVEEPETSEQENASQAKPKKGPELKSKAPAANAGLKRRKLGATLFDDVEDAEEASVPAKPQPAPGRKAKAKLGGPINAFGGANRFSPRKKDKRSHTSFLV